MKVLAIDDEPRLLKHLVKTVQACLPEAMVSEFETPEEVLSLLKTETVPFDIAFLDIELGTMNGVTLAKNIKARFPSCNIVFCTGYSEYATEAFSVGASDYLIKPITEEKMRHALAQLRNAPEIRSAENSLYIRCFGEFEVFYKNEPLLSLTRRSKELFAFLVDKQGAAVSSIDIISTIFMDYTDSYFRVAKKDLTEALESIGMGDILLREWGKLGIRPEKVSCDYYDYVSGKPAAINLYKGGYMCQYEWAHATEKRLSQNEYR